MKMLKKLALVTAVATISSTTFALEQLDDETLAQTTGQDGITIKITPDAAGIIIDELYIHDNDGLATTASITVGANAPIAVVGGTGAAGAVLVNDLKIKGDAINVVVDTDAGGGTPFINAQVAMAGTTTISIGGVEVVQSGTSATTYSGTAMRQGTANTKVLGGLSLAIQDASMNIQLGAQPQGAMVKMNATVTNGLKIENLEIIDADGHVASSTAPRKGGLLVKKLVLTDTGSANLTLKQDIDIDSEHGIVIKMDTGAGFYAYAEDVGFSDGTGGGVFGTTVGGAANNNIMGDIEMVGLQMGQSTIAISGH